jgi:Family of unknown function (DUF6516)
VITLGQVVQRVEVLDTLLHLDGQVLVLDGKGEYWVKFSIRRVRATPERPHGLDYSFTLHGKDNERLIGFDNAHATRQSNRPGGKGQTEYDHKHRVDSVRRIDIGMQPRCWRISGTKWTLF